MAEECRVEKREMSVGQLKRRTTRVTQCTTATTPTTTTTAGWEQTTSAIDGSAVVNARRKHMNRAVARSTESEYGCGCGYGPGLGFGFNASAIGIRR